MAAREVSQSLKSLSECISDGEIPTPELMRYVPEWTQWRQTFGRIPNVLVGGVGTTLEEESALWRETMAWLYGPGRREELEQIVAARRLSVQ